MMKLNIQCKQSNSNYIKEESCLQKKEDVPLLQIEIPVEFEDLEIEELKSALEKFSDEVAKQIGFFYTKILMILT